MVLKWRVWKVWGGNLPNVSLINLEEGKQPFVPTLDVYGSGLSVGNSLNKHLSFPIKTNNGTNWPCFIFESFHFSVIYPFVLNLLLYFHTAYVVRTSAFSIMTLKLLFNYVNDQHQNKDD